MKDQASDMMSSSSVFLCQKRKVGFLLLLAYCTGVGKGILAFLKPDEINSYLRRVKLDAYTPHTITKKSQFLKEMEAMKERGHSIDREETVLGLACIGVPISGLNSRLEGAISLSGDVKDVYHRMEALVPGLLDTAKEISRSLGYFPGHLGIGILAEVVF